LKFLCCLLPGRYDHGAPEPEARTSAAAAASDVQPNRLGERKPQQGVVELLLQAPHASGDGMTEYNFLAGEIANRLAAADPKNKSLLVEAYDHLLASDSAIDLLLILAKLLPQRFRHRPLLRANLSQPAFKPGGVRKISGHIHSLMTFRTRSARFFAPSFFIMSAR
jgi:hypothetical protein